MPHLLLMLLGLLLLAACTPVRPLETASGSEQPTTAASSEEATPDPLAAAVARDLGVETAGVTIVSREAVEWPDACLGVTAAGEMCGQVITPGYRVVVESEGRQYTFHTDLSGSFVRRAAAAEAASSQEGGKEQALTSLTYAGPEEAGSADVARCASLTIVLNEARLTSCDGIQSTQPLPQGLALTLAEMLDRFAPFTYEAPGELLTFAGRGEMGGPEWQAAILAWARTTQAELASGQTSATARTALSWNLGPLPAAEGDSAQICAHLTVLDYGFAYAEQRPCTGGDLLSSVGGWLEQGEMELFSGWLRAFEPSYVEDNYLDGLGAASMSEEESAAVAAWAQALWTRLVGVSLAPAEGAAALCRAPDAGGVFESTTYGFCLGTPPGYAVVETEPGSFSLVAGGDVMNHVDPRVSIEVTDTGDRTLAQVAAEMAAAYAAPGETLEAQAVSVGGVEGVLFDNLIGQDPNRRLAVVHAGRLYSLMMTPLTPAAEPFYQDVLASLRFVGQ